MLAISSALREKRTTLNQLQPLEARVPVLANDDVVMHGDAKGRAASTIASHVSRITSFGRSLAWAGGRLSPCRCFRLRRRTDRHRRTRVQKRLRQAASPVFPGPLPSADRLA